MVGPSAQTSPFGFALGQPQQTEMCRFTGGWAGDSATACGMTGGSGGLRLANPSRPRCAGSLVDGLDSAISRRKTQNDMRGLLRADRRLRRFALGRPQRRLTCWFRGGWALVGVTGCYRVTLPALMQRVQTLMRFGVPLTTVRTRCTLGFHRRLVRRCEWDTLLPKPGTLPQTSHVAATIKLLKLSWVPLWRETTGRV